MENIEPGINGFLFTPQDIDDFTEKLKTLVNNSALRQKMGKNGRKLVLAEYTWEQTVSNLINIWQKAIDRAKANKVNKNK